MEFEDGKYLFREDDPKLFKKIILSSLLDKLKKITENITAAEYLDYRLNNVVSENILIYKEIMKKSNYEILNQL